MYWRLTSREKPIKQGRIKVFAAWEDQNERQVCIYNANHDTWIVQDFFSNKGYSYEAPYCWSYIDKLPSDEE